MNVDADSDHRGTARAVAAAAAGLGGLIAVRLVLRRAPRESVWAGRPIQRGVSQHWKRCVSEDAISGFFKDPKTLTTRSSCTCTAAPGHRS